MDYELTPEARVGLDNILEYLDKNFGERLADGYYEDFEHILHLATLLPESYPIVSENRKLRKLVFRKRTTIYYQMIDYIKVIAIIDNRQDFKIE